MRSFRRFSLVAALLLGLGATPVALADVYVESPLGSSQANNLAGLMPRSMSPGGVREVRINDSPMTVTRLVTPSIRDVHSAVAEYVQPYLRYWPDLAEDYAMLNQMFVQREKYNSNEALDLAASLVVRESARTVSNLEAPQIFPAGRWIVVSRIPVSAVQPENRLAATPVTEGFIVFFDSEPAIGGYASSWEIRFEEGFRLLDVIGNHDGDVPGSDPFDIVKPSGSRRALVYEEKANRWDSATWSYEATGTVAGNLNYYVSAFQKLGFSQRGPAVHKGNESMVQMSRGGETVVVHAVNMVSTARPIQVTIQRLG